MKVVTLKDLPDLPVEGAAEQSKGWTGPVSRSRQTIIPPGDSDNYNCSVVNFSQGCNTGWHIHDCDQLLVVTSGSGIVATETEEYEINVGDVAQVKACALRQRLVSGMRYATRQPRLLAHPMVARGEDDGHLAAAGVCQGAFCGLRSGGAGARMAFKFPIRLNC